MSLKNALKTYEPFGDIIAFKSIRHKQLNLFFGQRPSIRQNLYPETFVDNLLIEIGAIKDNFQEPYVLTVL